ncbi:unannotated protein [freshwater metagenome]|uniref:Unannotated protein n=1 Tax=freshwater metagenome TaxID=449393 RepID=A0A6J6Y937_9ZZZZ
MVPRGAGSIFFLVNSLVTFAEIPAALTACTSTNRTEKANRTTKDPATKNLILRSTKVFLVMVLTPVLPACLKDPNLEIQAIAKVAYLTLWPRLLIPPGLRGAPLLLELLHGFHL